MILTCRGTTPTGTPPVAAAGAAGAKVGATTTGAVVASEVASAVWSLGAGSEQPAQRRTVENSVP